MTKEIKLDKAPGEFKCRTCQTTWSSFMANNNPCTESSERFGLHNFDFKKPVV